MYLHVHVRDLHVHVLLYSAVIQDTLKTKNSICVYYEYTCYMYIHTCTCTHKLYMYYVIIVTVHVQLYC